MRLAIRTRYVGGLEPWVAGVITGGASDQPDLVPCRSVSSGKTRSEARRNCLRYLRTRREIPTAQLLRCNVGLVF